MRLPFRETERLDAEHGRTKRPSSAEIPLVCVGAFAGEETGGARGDSESNLAHGHRARGGCVQYAVGRGAWLGAAHGWALPWLWMLWAALCVQGRLMCNLLDGIVAIEGGKKAKGGDIFNEVPDRIEDTLFFVGAGYASGHLELGWSCAVLAVFTAYLRAFGASLGQGQDFGGPCAKQQRMAILTAGLVGQAICTLLSIQWDVLTTALWIVAIGTAITAVLRLQRMYRKAP